MYILYFDIRLDVEMLSIYVGCIRTSVAEKLKYEKVDIRKEKVLSLLSCVFKCVDGLWPTFGLKMGIGPTMTWTKSV